MSGRNKVKIGHVLKGFQLLPCILAAVLAVLTVLMYIIYGLNPALMCLGALVIYLAATLIFYIINRNKAQEGLIRFAMQFKSLEQAFIKEIPQPCAVIDSNGELIMCNDLFRAFCGDDSGVNICSVFTELKQKDLDFDGRETDIAIRHNKRDYRIHFDTIHIPEDLVDDSIAIPLNDGVFLYAVYMFDETEITELMRANLGQQAIVGTLYVDNYSEVLEQVEDENRMLVSGLIDKEIYSYFSPIDGIVRKIEKDRYFILFRREFLPSMQRNRFDLLDKIKKISTGVDMPVTISMGVGAGENYMKSQEAAKEALSLALGRGGDQVVVKEDDRTYFYGGKTKSVEKNTRVKARVNSIALREILLGVKRVVIMGHKIGDIDCLGAAVGIYKAARSLEKDAFIVLNELENSMQQMVEEFLDDPDYGEGAFITVDESPKYVDEDTALVVVDVNNPEHFERRDLIFRTKTIVIIDHHLQSDVKIDNVRMSYIEPTASSACEMITELLQYIKADMKLKKLEAEALYAGIMIDTGYFSKNTGVRTFEAAAYLRRYGVDVGRVRSLFSDTLEDYKAMAATINSATFIASGYAMAVAPSKGVENPTIVAAKVANELLDLSGIRASFVLVDYDGKIYISARSNGKVNVQLIMERMGGGGHMNMAGAQLKGETAGEAERKLRLTVKKMMEEGIIE